MGFEWKALGPHFGDRSAADLTEADCNSYVAGRGPRAAPMARSGPSLANSAPRSDGPRTSA